MYSQHFALENNEFIYNVSFGFFAISISDLSFQITVIVVLDVIGALLLNVVIIYHVRYLLTISILTFEASSYR
jgi:hypothetical protein